MAQLFNGYRHKSSQVGGGIPVWVEIPKDTVTGAYLQNTLRIDEVLASGSPVEHDYKNHTAKILKCFEVTEVTVSGTNSVISIAKNAITPLLYAGMNVMVAPSTLAGTGKAVAITSVDQSDPDLYKITVVTADIDDVGEGDFLVEADKSGAGAKLYAIPNNLTKDDTIGGDQNTVGIPRGVKYIYENMIPAMPEVIKSHIVDVAHVEFAWFPEVQ